MRCLLPLVLLLILTACYDSAGTPGTYAEAPAVTSTLGELRRLYAGTTFEISSNVIVTGYVTSHDRDGNFYRTLTIEQDGAAAELMAGIDGLHNIYPEGYLLTINLNGLAVGESRGILQIGRLPAPGSGYPTDYIGSRAALDRHVVRSSERISLRPLIASIADLTPATAGRLVRIDQVRYTPPEPEPGTWSGTKIFTDDENCILYTYTRIYADFADDVIPSGEVLLTGILQCDRTIDGTMRYTLRLRDATDCWY